MQGVFSVKDNTLLENELLTTEPTLHNKTADRKRSGHVGKFESMMNFNFKLRADYNVRKK